MIFCCDMTITWVRRQVRNTPPQCKNEITRCVSWITGSNVLDCGVYKQNEERSDVKIMNDLSYVDVGVREYY